MSVIGSVSLAFVQGLGIGISAGLIVILLNRNIKAVGKGQQRKKQIERIQSIWEDVRDSVDSFEKSTETRTGKLSTEDRQNLQHILDNSLKKKKNCT